VVIASFDVAYGGEQGLNHAINQAEDAIGNVRFVEEKKLISKFY